MYVWGLCELSRAKRPQERGGGGCSGNIHTTSILNGKLWTASHRKHMHRTHAPAYTQICSDNPGPSALTPASAAARTAVRNSPLQKPSQVALRSEQTAANSAAGHNRTDEGETFEFVCVTHLIGVLWVELCLHVLVLLLHSGLAALARGSPLPACTHHILSI